MKNSITKAEALKNYKKAKAEYLADMTNEKWMKYCDAKIVCKSLGVII